MQKMTGNNNSDLTEMNRSAVVKILQQREICSRADIARQTGLTPAAITKITAALIEMGIVSEVSSMKGNSNRRSIGLQLNADRYQVIGVKFARNMFSVGLFDISGKIYVQTETEYTLEEDQHTVLLSVKNLIQDLLTAYENVVAIGLALPGPYLRDEGRIAVVTQMPTWHNVNFLKEFKDAFNKPVFIEHDAKAGALASWWFGEHSKSFHSLTYFLVGDGVGAGIINDGKLLFGAHGTASELGHISMDVHGPRCECGNYGCLELYCSAPAMIKLARQQAPECLPQGKLRNRDACHAIFQAARAGNQNALEVVQEVATYIGYGCITIINAYNPDVIVIGDSVSQGGDLLLPTIHEVVKQRVIAELYAKVQIEISGLSIDPTLYGAAAVAANKVLELPSAFLAARKEKE